MQTAVRQSDLQELGRTLQQRLAPELSKGVPIQVRCLLQDGILLVLVQHTEQKELAAPPIFQALQEAIQELQPEFSQQVRLYLRAVGQKQPYAVQDFAIAKRVPQTTVEKSKRSEDLDDDDSDDLDDLFKWLGEPDKTEASEVSKIDRTPVTETAKPEPIRAPSLDSMADLSLEEPPTQEKEDKEEPDLIFPQPKTQRKGDRTTSRGRVPFRDRTEEKSTIPPTLLIAAISVGVVGFFSSLYIFSRPCVAGSCPQIETAKQLERDATQSVKKAKNTAALQNGKKKLVKATELLASIPFWSRYHSEAQKLLPNYRTQANKIDPVLTAMEKADEAAQKSQKPPHPIEDWQEIESQWRQAIALLRQVPKNSSVYPLAQQKLQEYQINLSDINGRVKTEEESANRIILAKQTAQSAEVLQVSAKSVENWQEVESIWDKAMNVLSAIPKTTMAYEEAQKLIEDYEPKLATVRQRRSQEQIAANIYTQSVTVASLAQTLEQRNQWTQAVASWRRALTYAQQVPKSTFYYPQSQPLIDSYSNALAQAEEKLKVALVLQKANSDLNKVCTSNPKICDHIVTRQGIKVYLTPAYVNSVRRTAMSAGINGDARILAGVDDHLKTLQSALEAISENAGLPLEIYDNNRSLIGSYTPKPS